MSGGDLTLAGFEENKREAAEKFDVEQRNDNTLLLDLDTPESLAQFERVFPKLRDQFDLGDVRTWKSKSQNTHVAITLTTPQPFSVRIALQAALGSDGVRELLSIKRAEYGCVEPSLLFRPRSSAIDVLDPRDVDSLLRL